MRAQGWHFQNRGSRWLSGTEVVPKGKQAGTDKWRRAAERAPEPLIFSSALPASTGLVRGWVPTLVLGLSSELVFSPLIQCESMGYYGAHLLGPVTPYKSISNPKGSAPSGLSQGTGSQATTKPATDSYLACTK